MSASVARKVVGTFRRPEMQADALSAREQEVLGMIAEGHSNAAIARLLVVTPGAVEKHTQRIFAKLGLTPDDDAAHRRVLSVVRFLRAG